MSLLQLKNKFLSILLLTIVSGYFSSCNKGPCYRYDVSEISLDSIQSVFLEGTKLPINMEEVDVFYCIDSLIIIHKGTGYFDHPFIVYNSVTCDSITGFVSKGRSRNEFLSNPTNPTKQIYKRNGDYIMPLMDNNVCKEVNLNKTLDKKFTVIERISDGLNFLNGTAVLYGEDYTNKFVYIKGHSDEMFVEGQVLPQIRYIDEKDRVKGNSVYKRFPDNKTDANAALFYYGVIFKQPEGNIVAQPLYQMSYIMFYDIENYKYHAIHIDGARTFEDGIPEDKEEQNSMAFLDDAGFSKDYLFVLYMGDFNKMRQEDPDYFGRILQFDWDGNLLKSFILHDWVNRISYDEVNHILYGANYWFGELYSFGVID